MVILCVTLVPFFYRAGVFTAYEYLEKRFDGRTRTLTSLLFLVSRGLSVGVTLYAPSLVLSVILGWSEGATILLMAGSTIVYVLYGGNKSVIWTDVVQMTFIWFGIFLCVGDRHPSPSRGRRAARRPGARPDDRAASGHRRLAEPHEALHALERPHRRALPDALLLRLRPEPGAALPLGEQPHPEPALPALQRLSEGSDAVPDPADGDPGVRLLPFPRASPPLEPGRAGALRTAGPEGRRPASRGAVRKGGGRSAGSGPGLRRRPTAPRARARPRRTSVRTASSRRCERRRGRSWAAWTGPPTATRTTSSPPTSSRSFRAGWWVWSSR